MSPGYWREHESSDIIVYCKNKPGNCLGGMGDSTCSEGHIGPLCESCDIENDYTRADNFLCGNCDDKLINAFKILGLVLFYVKTLIVFEIKYSYLLFFRLLAPK